jgi:hypothetical protein
MAIEDDLSLDVRKVVKREKGIDPSFADDTNLTIKVRHYPPGTSKWNKIEHRLFCHITQNWRGRPHSRTMPRSSI